MYTPQHAHTNYTAFLPYLKYGKRKFNEHVSVTPFYGIEAGCEVYRIDYCGNYLRVGVNHSAKILIPLHIESWQDGINEDVFISDTSIAKPASMIKGDQLLWKMGKMIKFYAPLGAK